MLQYYESAHSSRYLVSTTPPTTSIFVHFNRLSNGSLVICHWAFWCPSHQRLQRFDCYNKLVRSISITKTYLYNFDPLKPHFYVVKLGFTGVYIIFRISAKNIVCGYSLEPPRWGGSNEYPRTVFEQKYEKYQNFFSENFQFLEVKFSKY